MSVNLSAVNQNLQSVSMGQITYYPPLMGGCVLYLPLWWTELAGSTITSRDTNAHSCTVTGAVWGSTGRLFDGTDNTISIPDHVAWSFGGGDFTIWLWANLDAINTSDTLLFQGSTTTNFSWGLYAESNSKIYFDSYDTSNARHSTISWTHGLSASTWHHIVCYRYGDTMELYVDASVVGSTQTLDWDIRDVALSLRISDDWAGALYALAGKIGEIGICKGRAFQASEVTHNYLATKWRYK